jgi:hypothetical protein
MSYVYCPGPVAACADGSKWSNLVQMDTQVSEVQIVVTTDGRPRLLVRRNGNTGYDYDYEAAAIDITLGGKLYYGWCDTACTQQDAPFQIVQIASGEGQHADLAIDAQGRTHMVYDAGQRGTIGEVWCDANCTSASQWQRRILETNAQLMQEFAPASPLSCDQQERVWLDAIPAVAFDAQGRLVVAYDIKNVARCYYYDPAHPNDPIYTKVERLWWAVRWASFARP